MSAVVAVIDDLREESDELDSLVGVLDAGAWRGPTPAARWTVAHQIAHLSWTDEVALLAATEPALSVGGRELRVGLSIGCASVSDLGAPDGPGFPVRADLAEALLERADQRMYDDKRSGRPHLPAATG